MGSKIYVILLGILTPVSIYKFDYTKLIHNSKIIESLVITYILCVFKYVLIHKRLYLFQRKVVSHFFALFGRIWWSLYDDSEIVSLLFPYIIWNVTCVRGVMSYRNVSSKEKVCFNYAEAVEHTTDIKKHLLSPWSLNVHAVIMYGTLSDFFLKFT